MSNYRDVVRFANDRHRAWAGAVVNDPIVRQHKFTNVFRVLDRGSQYLLELLNVFSPLQRADRVALSYFYRQVNKPETMDMIIDYSGGVPGFAEITDPLWYVDVVHPMAAARPKSFLSGAYMILIIVGDKRGTVDKMQERFPAVADDLLWVAAFSSLHDRYHALRQVPGLGPFLSMQIATDLGYASGETDQENDFIVAGPGSRRGVSYMLGSSSLVPERVAEQVIRDFPVDRLPFLPRSGGRAASLMDVQNVFCEYSKLIRLRSVGWSATRDYARRPAQPIQIPEQFRRQA